MILRITIASIGFLSILTGPWWVPLVCMILLSARWVAWEALAIGLLMDFIWQGSGTFAISSWHTWPLFTIVAIILLWAFDPLRRRFLF
ncbi:hypothetical protein FJY93_01860 [Candidatus Kaiserbacteria bacterium]|nr:hypothetical protein [Candidatus Kaiserbacteria bacterium]